MGLTSDKHRSPMDGAPGDGADDGKGLIRLTLELIRNRLTT